MGFTIERLCDTLCLV